MGAKKLVSEEVHNEKGYVEEPSYKMPRLGTDQLYELNRIKDEIDRRKEALETSITKWKEVGFVCWSKSKKGVVIVIDGERVGTIATVNLEKMLDGTKNGCTIGHPI